MVCFAFPWRCKPPISHKLLGLYCLHLKMSIQDHFLIFEVFSNIDFSLCIWLLTLCQIHGLKIFPKKELFPSTKEQNWIFMLCVQDTKMDKRPRHTRHKTISGNSLLLALAMISYPEFRLPDREIDRQVHDYPR